MSIVIKRGPHAPQMNMTPLIDVVFQLILFFMLVNNIVAEESIQMIVPLLEDPETQQLGDVHRIVINAGTFEYDIKSRQSNPLNVAGEMGILKAGHGTHYEWNFQEGAGKEQALTELTSVLQEAKIENPKVQVVLRADAALYYEDVQQVMQAITAAKIDTTNVVAYLPGESPWF